MSLYNVKIKVSTENFEKGSHQRKRCVVAGEIDSIYDIFLAVRKNFGPVELTEIYYKDDDDDAIDVSTKADFDMMAWNKIKVLEVIIKDWIPKCMPHYVEDPNKWQSPDFHYFF